MNVYTQSEYRISNYVNHIRIIEIYISLFLINQHGRDTMQFQYSICILLSFTQLYNQGRLCQLGMEFSELDTFLKVLNVNDKR